jgi:hypothetical protein
MTNSSDNKRRKRESCGGESIGCHFIFFGRHAWRAIENHFILFDWLLNSIVNYSIVSNTSIVLYRKSTMCFEAILMQRAAAFA